MLTDGNGSLTKRINPVWFSVKNKKKFQKKNKKPEKIKNMLVFIYCKITKVDG